MRRPFHLGLLGKFALASAVPLLAMGSSSGSTSRHRVHDRTLAQAKSSAELIARVGFQSQIKPRSSRAASCLKRIATPSPDTQSKSLEDGLTRIKIWNRSGTVVYSDKADQIGDQVQAVHRPAVGAGRARRLHR